MFTKAVDMSERVNKKLYFCRTLAAKAAMIRAVSDREQRRVVGSTTTFFLQLSELFERLSASFLSDDIVIDVEVPGIIYSQC